MSSMVPSQTPMASYGTARRRCQLSLHQSKRHAGPHPALLRDGASAGGCVEKRLAHQQAHPRQEQRHGLHHVVQRPRERPVPQQDGHVNHWWRVRLSIARLTHAVRARRACNKLAQEGLHDGRQRA